MKLILYAVILTIISILIDSLFGFPSAETLTGNILNYVLFFIVMLIMFYIIEKRNKK